MIRQATALVRSRWRSFLSKTLYHRAFFSDAIYLPSHSDKKNLNTRLSAACIPCQSDMYEALCTTGSPTHNTSKAVMSPGGSSIGLLAQLPREVRDLIWENFIPSYGQGTNLSILRTCRQLYAEVASRLYQDEVLRFYICPTYQYQSWLSIVTHRGAKLHLRDEQDAVSRGFSSLPYAKLKGLIVEVGAPDPTDPGQMICLWKKAGSLADLLSQGVDGLPDLDIHLVNSQPSEGSSGESRWSTAGIAQQSIPCDRNHEYYDEYDEDFEAILQPFCRLRNARSASVQVATEIDAVGYLLENTAAFMVLDKPFGCHGAEGEWSDDSTQGSLNRNFLRFDNALDDLPGPTARMLRLERFSSWFEERLYGESKHLDELERAFHSDHSSTENLLYAIYNRCAMALAFNPLSETMQEMRFRKHWWTPGDGPHAFPLRDEWSASAWDHYVRMSMALDDDDDRCLEEDEEEEGGRYASRWDREEWHRYYRDGIPCLNSKPTQKLYVQMADPGRDPRRDAMHERFVPGTAGKT